MARLLLVDDDGFVRSALSRLLAAEGFFCTIAGSGAEARRALSVEAPDPPFDLILLDVGLPDMDGYSLCRQIRGRHRMPILILTARGESADKVVGLEVGADDYLIKPVDPRELVARIRAHLRRATEYQQPRSAPRRIDLGGVMLDLDARDAFREGRALQLTDREFELLHLLARHPSRALSSEWIFETVWGASAELGIKTLAVTVSRLRQKIETDPAVPRIIQTVRGFGYRLVPGPADEAPPAEG